ncbi:hypothetical protein K3495_g10515 [Podosphaera aphanis]|nr:hypothetical protein K3495_g10515 [Podosphaera aphanis]
MASSSEETKRLVEPTTVKQIVKPNRERDILVYKLFQELEKRCTEFSRHFQEIKNLYAERDSDLTRRLDEFSARFFDRNTSLDTQTKRLESIEDIYVQQHEVSKLEQAKNPATKTTNLTNNQKSLITSRVDSKKSRK